MADRNVVGSSSRASADFAPDLPCSARACRRERFEETSAISDIEKNPFNNSSNKMTPISLQTMHSPVERADGKRGHSVPTAGSDGRLKGRTGNGNPGGMTNSGRLAATSVLR